MKLLYITTLHYPSPYANRVNVMKMSQSFAELCDFGLLLGDVSTSVEDVLKEYGMEKKFPVSVLFKKPLVLKPRAFFAALKIKKIIASEPPETIFYIRDFLLAYFLSWISRRFRSRYFIECQSLGKFSHFLYRRVFQGARGVISSNHAKKEEIHERYGVSLENIVVGPNGFDEELFKNLPTQADARKKLGFLPDIKIVMYVGSMLPWKGTDVIYEVACLLPQYTFVLVGADRDEEKNNIRIIAKKDNREIPAYLRVADLLLAPYRTDSVRAQKYFSPIKVFEYMAAQVPFAITDLPAVREFLSDEETYFVKEYSKEAFRDAIVSAIKNPDERMRRAENAHRKSPEFSWQARAGRILDFIEGYT
ncbi:MAG: Glycosyl transferase group 1 [Parcubacteria group bacterium GW2011_GWA2_47_10b]|nr:MAG: Glycosyl transferase group 1 [Parcubacteria group bacterium GW2011_GWA2_47_10b]